MLLNRIIEGNKNANFFTDFAIKLAELHKHTNLTFGWEHDNFIGSLPQKNQQYTEWSSFFIESRMLPMVKRAFDNRLIEKSLLKQFNSFFKEVESIFPKEVPALLHGDLWGGNYMVTQSNKPALIDPACYYGHREMDLSMTQLFGGFSDNFIEAYNVYYPLEKNWEDRISIAQLYPNLVHLNLFGKSYLNSIQKVINSF